MRASSPWLVDFYGCRCNETSTAPRKVGPRSSPDFKVECAQLVIDRGYSFRDAAQAMGVGKSTLDKWVRKLKSERPGHVLPGQPLTDEQREIAELKRQIKCLEIEKDILKKALTLLIFDSMNDFR
ncbi:MULTISPECIES: transposase [unclassified Marinobacter]|uniref:transposase n=1 Tax=unclassified Marinobacter TaxID=83889 RepID=UPI000BF78868|nr:MULTISPECIES: transposase [unclassified Marinobacter]